MLAKLKERGEGVVAQCPKAACEKVAKAFTDIGLDAEARKIEVPASDYDGSDVMDLLAWNLETLFTQTPVSNLVSNPLRDGSAFRA